MRKNRSTFEFVVRLSALLLGGILAASPCLAAKKTFSITAGARQFTGQQLILPITGPATGVGWARQETAAGTPFDLTLSGAQINRPATQSTAGLFLAGGAALQLKTSLAVQVPPVGAVVKFSAGGRTGPPLVRFCPGGTKAGSTVFNGPAPYNPNCTVVQSAAAAGIGVANGIMTYTATANQFGGVGALAVQGTAELAVWIALPGNNPTTTNGAFGQVAFAGDIVSASGVGNPIDSPPNYGVLDGLAVKKLLGYTPSGIITSVGATIFAAADLAQTAWPGLLTTGRMKVSVTAVQGPISDIFTVTGSDSRDAAGIGNITLVSGQISKTNLTGHSGTRNVVTITVTPEPTTLIGASCALVALVGSHQLVKRRRARRS